MQEKDIQSFVENYTNANGDNPISAALSLWTIAKSVPLQFIKAGAVGGLFLLSSLFLLYYLDLSITFKFVLLGLSVLGTLPLFLFGALKFISAFVINAVADVLTGLLAPIDEMYDVFKSRGNAQLSRMDFSKKVVQQVVLPRVSDALGYLPMKGSVAKILGVFADRFAKSDKDKEVQQAITYEDIQKSTIKTMMAKVNSASQKSRSVLGKPFWFVAFSFFIGWALAILLSIAS